MKSAQEMYASAKSGITEVSVADVQARLANGEQLVLIDVREQNEWNLGHPEPAIYIGRGVLESQIEQRVPRDATVVLSCQSGNRSALAARTLMDMGYKNVSSMAGGFSAWVAAGGPIAD